MTICGIEMSASEVRLVLLQGDKENFTLVETEPRKIKLTDDADQAEVKAFRDSIFAYFRENQVTEIVIKKRGKKGDFSGGPVGFKLEGIIQLYEKCPVSLIAPQTISAVHKKYAIEKPKELRKYQHTAFETAFCKLHD
jgi:hypothetical protein